MGLVPITRVSIDNPCFFEPTCAYARWAHMHHFASVCDWTKSDLSKVISMKPLDLQSPNLVRAWTCMTPRSPLSVRVIGQRSRSQGQNAWFLVSNYIFIGQCIKVKGTWVEVKGHLGQGQRSLGSRLTIHSRYWQVGSHQCQVAFFIPADRSSIPTVLVFTKCILFILNTYRKGPKNSWLWSPNDPLGFQSQYSLGPFWYVFDMIRLYSFLPIISADFPRIFDPPEISTNLGRK